MTNQPSNAFGDEEIEEIEEMVPAKPPEKKASSSRDNSKMDGDRRYAMLLEENMRLKEEKKRLEAEKFQLVLDCDNVKCEFQEFVDSIHPLRDCHPGPDVGEPLMPYEIAAFKRDPVKFADLNPELREPLVQEMKWRIEDAKLRQHALRFLRNKREDRYMGPEFEPEARRVAKEMAMASFAAHKDFVPIRDEPEPLPSSPVIASCTLQLETGEAHFAITLSDDMEAVERGFEVITTEREVVDVVMEEDDEYNERLEVPSLFERQEDSSRRLGWTDHFSLEAQTLSRDQELRSVGGNIPKMRRPRAQTDGLRQGTEMRKKVLDWPAKQSGMTKDDKSTEGLSSSRDSSFETVTSKIRRGGAKRSLRGRVRNFPRPRGRGSNQGGATQRKNTTDDVFNLYDYISERGKERFQSTALKCSRPEPSTGCDLPESSHSSIDGLFGNVEVGIDYVSRGTRASTMQKSLQSLLTGIKRKQPRKSSQSIQGSEGSASAKSTNQITSSQRSEGSTSGAMGDAKNEEKDVAVDEAAANGE